MAGKPKTNELRDFLADPDREVAEHHPDSFEEDFTINKSLLSPQKTPRTIFRTLLRSNELPEGSPLHPMSPSPPPTPEYFESTDPNSPHSSPSVPAKSPSKTPEKIRQPSAQSDIPSSQATADDLEETMDSAASVALDSQEDPDATIDSGAPYVEERAEERDEQIEEREEERTEEREEEREQEREDSQEAADATVDSGAPDDEMPASSDGPNKETPTPSSPPRSPVPSQSSDVSFVSPGLSESSVSFHGARKERLRKRGRRNSRILDSTTDKSTQSSTDDEGISDAQSPAFEDSQPPVDDHPTTTTTTTTATSSDNNNPFPELSSVPTPPFVSPPASPSVLSSVPTPPIASPELASVPTPPIHSRSPSPPPSSSSVPASSESTSTPSPPRSGESTPSQPRETARKPRPSLSRNSKSSKSPERTPSSPSSQNWSSRRKHAKPAESASPDENNISVPLPSPAEKWSTRKRQRHGKATDTQLSSPSSPSSSASPQKLGEEQIEATKPTSTPPRTKRASTRPKSPITTPNQNDISVPFPSPPEKWSTRKRQRPKTTGIELSSPPKSGDEEEIATPTTPESPTHASPPKPTSTTPKPPATTAPPKPLAAIPKTSASILSPAEKLTSRRQRAKSTSDKELTTPRRTTRASLQQMGDQGVDLNISVPFPSPPEKWTPRKRLRPKKQEDGEAPGTPEVLRNADLIEDVTPPVSPSGDSVLDGRVSVGPTAEGDVSVPYDDSPEKWESRRGEQRRTRSDVMFTPREDEERGENDSLPPPSPSPFASSSPPRGLSPRAPPTSPRTFSPPSPTHASTPTLLATPIPTSQSTRTPIQSVPAFQAYRPISAPQEEYDRKLFTDSPFPATSAAQNMAAYKAILGKPPISMPPPPPRRAPAQQETKKTIKKPIKRKATQNPDSEDDDDDLGFPKSTTEEVYYDFAKKKISKDAMAAVHKGVNNFWLSFCKNIEDIRLKEGHGKRKKITLNDMKLLAEKMRFTNEMLDFNSMIRDMLPKELQECLIPIARAGNVVGVKKKP